MNTCKTCKYWASYSGECCNRDKFVHMREKKLPQDGLAYTDHEDFYTQFWFHTGQDFGCIHWEQKRDHPPLIG